MKLALFKEFSTHTTDLHRISAETQRTLYEEDVEIIKPGVTITQRAAQRGEQEMLLQKRPEARLEAAEARDHGAGTAREGKAAMIGFAKERSSPS